MSRSNRSTSRAESTEELKSGLRKIEARPTKEQRTLMVAEKMSGKKIGQAEADAIYMALRYHPIPSFVMHGDVKMWAVGHNSTHFFYCGAVGEQRYVLVITAEDESDKFYPVETWNRMYLGHF